MGVSHSIPYMDNDYELVIRVSKELEKALGNPIFSNMKAITGDCDDEKDRQLTNMIKKARYLFRYQICNDMERLADLRNKLAQDERFTSLTPEDREFVYRSYPHVYEEITNYIRKNDHTFPANRLAIEVVRLQSSHYYLNDFEAVIRASKQLKLSLLEILDPRTWKPSLLIMISKVQHRFAPDVIEAMRTLCKLRNRIVHEYRFDALVRDDYTSFHHSKELVMLAVQKYKQINESVVSSEQPSFARSDYEIQSNLETTGNPTPIGSTPYNSLTHQQSFRTECLTIDDRQTGQGRQSLMPSSNSNQFPYRDSPLSSKNDGAGLAVGAAAVAIGAASSGIPLFRLVQRDFQDDPPAKKGPALSACHLITRIVVSAILWVVARKVAGVTTASAIAIGAFTLGSLPIWPNPPPLPVVCAKGHPTKRHLVIPNSFTSCNVCNKWFGHNVCKKWFGQRRDIIMFGCQECDFDVCQACSKMWAVKMHKHQRQK